MRPKRAKRGPDKAIAEIAANQHGVLSVMQLHAAGASPSAIKRRVAAGRLHRIHRRVYAVGHPRLSNEGRWMAAVLACGEGAVLSHRSAGELWRILRSPARRLSGAGGWGEGLPPVHVTVSGHGGRKKQRGITLHRSSILTAADCILRDSIPVTRPSRTLADLRPILSEAEFAGAIREAEFLRLPIGNDGRPSKTPRRTRTELESMFMALVRRHRLPRPEVNVKVDQYEVDFLWRDQRLIVEVDGWESHGTRSAFEEDRARDARLKLLGYDVLRFTWWQVGSDAHTVAATVRALLASNQMRMST
jgi:very-short-patch-repair endonuclease